MYRDLNTARDYKPFPDDVLAAIKPIYKELSSDNLLERCVSGFTQNNNESYNQLIWKITPKLLPAGSKIVEIAAYTAACMFNRGTEALLAIMYGMGIKLGRHSHEYVRSEDEKCVLIAEQRASDTTREARIVLRPHQEDALEIAGEAKELLYGPGIEDLI
ncbi:hypothetical protein TKK_0017679 [Trichogramma kaykai]